jgi:hypothetical protein
MNWFSSKMSSKEFALHMVIIVLCTSFISGFAFGNTHRGQARAEANVMGQTRDEFNEYSPMQWGFSNLYNQWECETWEEDE